MRQKEVEELQSQSQVLSQEGKGSEEVDGQRISVENKFNCLQAPLQKRRENLMASREIHQFNRDVEDEIVSRVIDRRKLTVRNTLDITRRNTEERDKRLKNSDE